MILQPGDRGEAGEIVTTGSMSNYHTQKKWGAVLYEISKNSHTIHESSPCLGIIESYRGSV